MTAYDRRFTELRALQAKRDRLIECEPINPQVLAVVERQIEKAQERFEIEGKRGLEDIWRKRHGIDEWRAGPGKEEYNASRRTVRATPNEKLTGWTLEQKERRKADKRSDNGWIKRRQEKGWTEDQIKCGLIVRQGERAATRKGQEQTTLDQATMEQLPGYGSF
ncbi:hypothetical protein [Rhizobium sp. TH2]|uniref:hypothetical protein n=1 Tax=Rhizobium sp. TH2 TaxID=2775403 RepID=UPI0021572003|nr:hypothetical protein [Rhizobium sp. TH2]